MCLVENGFKHQTLVIILGILVIICCSLCVTICVIVLIVRNRKDKVIEYPYSRLDITINQQSDLTEFLSDERINLIDWKELNDLEKIGSGGSAIVYRANWHSTVSQSIRTVAVKRLLLSLNNLTNRDKEEIKREILLMRELKHDNVLSLLAVCLSPDQEICLITVCHLN